MRIVKKVNITAYSVYNNCLTLSKYCMKKKNILNLKRNTFIINIELQNKIQLSKKEIESTADQSW